MTDSPAAKPPVWPMPEAFTALGITRIVIDGIVNLPPDTTIRFMTVKIEQATNVADGWYFLGHPIPGEIAFLVQGPFPTDSIARQEMERFIHTNSNLVAMSRH